MKQTVKTMKLFTTENINFQFPWRTYQKRILDNLDNHLTDNQLHIVAPPGSGKTVLGLEVVKRLNTPTLILAPTITIRNQWAERLTSDFLQEKPFVHATFDVKNPDLLTISTYQGLHTAFKDNPEKVLQDLRKIGIQNLVVDECHHLKNEWWKTLFQIKNKLNLTIIALTATPPFDVSGSEWQRYHQLCGEVDAEINVAELVADKNLCPHQDYIYFSIPTVDESVEITNFYTNIENFIDGLKNNTTFRNWLKSHPFLQNPESNLETIYETPDYFSALLIVNEFFNDSVPLGTVEVLGGDIEDLPKMDKDWLQLFLNQALFKDDYFLQFEKTSDFKNIIRELKKIGAIERKKIVLTEPDNINKKLRLSTSKLNSITTIVEHEWQSLKEDLRMVILTDYIRKEEMPTSELDIENQEKIGVVPIFERLRKRFPIEVNLGILSGSMVVIPKFALPQLEKIIQDKNLKIEQLSVKSLLHDVDYLQVETSGELRSKIVEVITELFTQGGITVLVGTKSLLGEGWDAPAVNSLVLATFVGSYVLSNQMRGRAIRTQKGNSDKTANIWHLVCLDTTDNKGGHDFQILERRFKAFHGVAFVENPMIENGIKRFHLPNFPINETKMNSINQRMLGRADNRSRLQLDWQKALGNGMVMIEEIKVPIFQQKSYQKVRLNTFKGLIQGLYKDLFRIKQLTIRMAFLGIIAGIIAYFFPDSWLVKGLIIFFSLIFIFGIKNYQYYRPIFEARKEVMKFALDDVKSVLNPLFFKTILTYIFVLIVAITALFYLKWTVGVIVATAFLGLLDILNRASRNIDFYKTTRNWQTFLNFNHDKLIEQTGKIILNMLLSKKNILQNDFEKINIKTITSENQTIVCYLENASTFQNELFIEALTECFNPITNPRYLISINRNNLMVFDQPFYVTVPSIFSKNKKDAENFANEWTTEISMNDLVYTQTPDGRLELLKARGLSLNPDLHPKAERVSAWR
jgi:superfamily II DNA or RNA helicase